MNRVRNAFQLVLNELPATAPVRCAAIFFSLSVLTYLFSIAASQACLAVAAGFALWSWRERPTIAFPPVKLALGLFCLLTILSLIWADHPSAGWVSVKKFVLLLILLLTMNVGLSKRAVETLYQILFLESGLAGVVGTIQFMSEYRAARAVHPSEVYHIMAYEQRIRGFMGHWMDYSGQQMLAFSALLAFLFLSARRHKAWWLVLAVIAISIALSLTRGVWLGCFAAVVYVLARWKPRWLWAIPVLLVVAYWAAPSLLRERLRMSLKPSSEVAVSIRLQMWQAGIRMIRSHPWLGVGPNNVEQDYGAYLPPGESPPPYHGHLHSDYLQLGAERGLLGLAAWLWFMAAWAWSIWRILPKLDQGRWIRDAALAAWLAFLVEGCFEFNFGTSPVLMPFLFIIATPFAAQSLGAKSGNPTA